jgi:predicted DNA binding CopG/RHH family protein
MAARKDKIPRFENDEAERQFWARHSVEEFADELEELDADISPPRSQQIAVRLYKRDLEALQDLARAKGVGHTTLARTVLEHWINRARGAMPPKSARPRTTSSRRKLPNKALQRASASGARR